MTHTPGPWFPKIESFRSYVMYHDAEFSRDMPVTSFDLPSLEANLQLMSAAPELLEALQNLLAVHDGEGGTRYHAGDIARAAIAKATGA